MWVCATGTRHSKSLERRCPRTACLRQGSKIIYSYYTRCALIRDCEPTAWDGFARPAETEATCIWKVSPQISKRLYYESQVRGKRRVEVISTKLVSGVLFSGDNRGLHGSRPHAIRDEIKAQVREHIESFPAQESHYSRQDDLKCRYLPESLSIARIHSPSVKTLTCYSDSCFGQNKNSQIICFWTHLMVQKRFSRIDHKYLVRGHTYLPNDRDFSQIEKRKSSARVYLPQDWEKVVRESCSSKPFSVQKMTRKKFLDMEPRTRYFTMRKKDHKGSPVLISKASWLNFGEGEEDGATISHPGEYWMRSSFSEEEAWQKVSIFKGRCKIPPPTNVQLPVKYPSGHPINPKKVTDLQTTIPYLPTSCRDFYVSLTDHPVSHQNAE